MQAGEEGKKSRAGGKRKQGDLEKRPRRCHAQVLGFHRYGAGGPITGALTIEWAIEKLPNVSELVEIQANDPLLPSVRASFRDMLPKNRC